MVLARPPQREQSDGLLFPALPSLLIGSRIAAASYGSELSRGSTYTFQPRAQLDNPGSKTSTAQARPPPRDTSRLAEGLRLRLPKPSFTGAFIGAGAGGAAFVGGSGKAVALWPFPKAAAAPPAPPSPSEPRRVLILMSNTGGGHKASAEAIRDAFKQKHGDGYKIDIIDMWKDHTPAPFNRMPDSYSFLVRHSILWRLSYQITQPKLFHVPYLGFVGCFMRNAIHKAFDIYQPDLVVSVHPLMQHVPIRVIKERIRNGTSPAINFATVVTDFTTCHNTWFHKQATRCFVATDFCAMLARNNGLQQQQIVQHGLPIRPIFSHPLPGRRAMRRRLGLEPGLPAVLLVGGGEGMGALEETVAQLDLQLADKAQVVVICGRNRKLLERLKAKEHPGGILVTACGFVDNIHEWMAACDCIITKAGPGTIAEALISGLPILLNGNVPCQEEGNIPYVIDNGVGTFETQPAKIATIIHSWLLGGPQEQEHFETMRSRAKELGRPDAVYQIVHDLAALADAPDFQYGPARTALNPKGPRLMQRKTQQAVAAGTA
ncbi:hypothetical protein QJQ45_019190 [Haematococcus lacustris]|nr:hypothetical protein QJQ45_019190 [Haematococcus lacustris]